MTTFLLIRHASCDPLGRWLCGRAPGVHLNEHGRAEAERLAARLSTVPLAAIYSSPLERARETAETLARAHGIDVNVSEAFHELDFGDWTGRPLASLDADPRWRRFNTHRSETRAPGGELMRETQARVTAELERLRAQHGRGNIAVVTHADVIRAAVTHLLAMSLDLLLRIEISPASVSIVEIVDDAPRLLLLNDTGSLPPS